MGRGRLLGGCAWLLGGLALLQTLYLRALPPPAPPRRRPPPFKPLPPPRGVLDASGTFRLYRDVLGPPPRWASPPDLVLATHGTPGRAAAALGGALEGGRWGGPLSVAVFGVPRAGLGQLLRAMGGPCRGLRGRLRLHVVLGAAEPPPILTPPLSPSRGPAAPGGCRGALGRVAAADPPSYTLGVPYPGNLLRNLAWAGAATGGGFGGDNGGPGPPSPMGSRFVLLLDADVVPSRGLREGFLRALRGGGPPLWGDGGDTPLLRASDGIKGVRNALDPPHQGFGVPNEHQGLDTLGVPNRVGSPNDVLGVPKGFHDPGVPSVLEGPSVLKDPNVPRDPSVLRDPNILKDPNALEDPNILKDPKALEDPNAPGPSHPPWTQVLFVLPAFEVRLGTPIPGTKAELRRLWGTGDARPFYGALCPRCQAPTDYGRWWALPPTPHLRVAYEAPWRDPWEPFYVGPAHGVPPFDERFLQYGFNRISQACELHVAGFRFAVLDGAFVVHGGFKEASGFHGGRGAEQHRNRLLFRRFRADLGQRYPGSPRRC
ncbi:LOW QUALITY PROTEIN: beta-1,4-glucuronyltransferase 1 [Neopsephotus bourkii]|uniref:LOW QUALITY PROTEIN: beta-1,4-glucuronyltransferase 1 n=1 Tax=Neopsephotus bourkii TaxID=309878 RepID=UPI002AA5591F|nr:LOW QUALITY PROTEIN: beta-1,4-glucuronyltransferase 1 [Neopsephotus bourkii]